MKLGFNMTVSEIIHSYCVMVNGGSGVLVNAMTQDYSYVLTAAHVIDEVDGSIVVTDYQGRSLEVFDAFLPAKIDGSRLYDCAVLKVAYQPQIAQQSLPAAHLQPQDNITFVGCPATERGSSDPIKHWDGHMTSAVNELILLTIAGIPGLETIRGMSGGGIYHVDGGFPYLVGVEFSMDGTGHDQQFGRARCYSLFRFEELIIANNSAAMVPAFLECFSRLKNKVFEFDVITPRNVESLKVALDGFTGHLINNGMPPPYELMTRYGLSLLVDGKRPNELKARELWVAYLEFLVICALLDESGSVDSEYLTATERKRRMLYTSDGSNWIRRIEELLKVARKLLDKDGVVIVASPQATAICLPKNFSVDNIVNNIAVVPSKGPFAVDAVEASIYKSFKLIHLEALRSRCVVLEEEKYKAVPDGVDQLRLFRDKIDEAINKRI